MLNKRLTSSLILEAKKWFPNIRLVQKKQVWWWRFIGFFSRLQLSRLTTMEQTIYTVDDLSQPNSTMDADLFAHELTHMAQCYYGVLWIDELKDKNLKPRNFIQRLFGFYLLYIFSQSFRVNNEIAAFIKGNTDREDTIYYISNYYGVSMSRDYIGSLYDVLLSTYKERKI